MKVIQILLLCFFSFFQYEILFAQQIQKEKLAGRIVVIEGNKVVIDEGRKIGLRPGNKLDVFSEEKRVGIIRLIQVDEDESNGIILKGRRKITEGMVTKKYIRSEIGVSISKINYPFFEIEPNPSFVMSRPKSLGNTGTIWKLMLIARGNGIGVDAAIGWADMQLTRALQVDGNLFLNLELLIDRIDLQLGGGGGIGVSLSTQHWARKRLHDIEYGKAISPLKGNYQVFVGLNMQLNRAWSVMTRYGYYGYRSLGDWEILEDVDDPIKDEWLEYKKEKCRGFTVQFGLVVWPEEFGITDFYHLLDIIRNKNSSNFRHPFTKGQK